MENTSTPSSGNSTGPMGSNPAKLTFWLGITTGIAIISTVGFVALLFRTGPGSDATAKVAAGTANTNAAAETVPADPSQPSGPVKAVSDDDHIRGDKDAEVFLVQYSDFECPFCKSFFPTLQQARQEYGDKVAEVFRHYPLSFHANAQKQAEASECVNELGGSDKFWEFSDAIFERTASGGTGLALTALGPLAKEIGVNETKFQECLDSGKYASKVQTDLTEGTAAGVSGTPTTFVVKKDGSAKLVSGAVPYAQLKQAIDAALAS
jgi:protein-disulfide isomerase